MHRHSQLGCYGCRLDLGSGMPRASRLGLKIRHAGLSVADVLCWQVLASGAFTSSLQLSQTFAPTCYLHHHTSDDLCLCSLVERRSGVFVGCMGCILHGFPLSQLKSPPGKPYDAPLPLWVIDLHKLTPYMSLSFPRLALALHFAGPSSTVNMIVVSAGWASPVPGNTLPSLANSAGVGCSQVTANIEEATERVAEAAQPKLQAMVQHELNRFAADRTVRSSLPSPIFLHGCLEVCKWTLHGQ